MTKSLFDDVKINIIHSETEQNEAKIQAGQTALNNKHVRRSLLKMDFLEIQASCNFSRRKL